MLMGRSKAYSSSWLQIVFVFSSHFIAIHSWSVRCTNDFYRDAALWCPRAQVSLNLENRHLDRRNLRSMPKILHAASLCLFQLISAQFTLEMCLAAQNRQKSIKKPLFWRSRSLNSVAIKSQCTTSY